jgi:lipopolysaccharide biosynthesis regulator YciM
MVNRMDTRLDQREVGTAYTAPKRISMSNLRTALGSAVVTEINNNLNTAIHAYRSVISELEKDRKIAATAIFRLGECYRKLGNKMQAVEQYQRVLRDFSEQTLLVKVARKKLAYLHPISVRATVSASS